MKKLCLGTYMKILCQARKTTTKQYHLIWKIFSIIKDQEKYRDESLQGHIKSGKNNFIETAEIETIEKSKLVAHFKNNIIPLLDEKKHKQIILIIRDILKEDDIDFITAIGFESEGYTKQDIINKVYFNFEETLANIFYYCTTKVLNIPYQNNIKQITADYINSFPLIDESIQLENTTTRVLSKIESTLDIEQFEKVFYKINTSHLTNPNPNEISIFCLDILNSMIDYKQIKNFIFDNIGNYIFSRAHRNNYKLDGKEKNITAYAIKAYNKKMASSLETNHFNEIMLYSFLECILKAPKIFSKMELQNKSGEFSTFSSGIHVLSLKSGSLPFNQFIFGASNTIESLEDAVDKSFEQILKVLSSKSEEFDLLESTILNKEFDAQTNEVLYSMIVPQKGSGVTKPEKAFGIFLGYSIDLKNEDIANEEYIKMVKEKLNNDLSSITEYINIKVIENGLQNYSFYVYILPLNNALIDKDKLMSEALEV